jgi:NADH:ubiquinone oxidoreductase subunit K
MNTEEIIRMAQECQLIGMRPHLDGIYQQSLVRFAALVAAAERKACISICEQHWRHSGTAQACADAIRARGNE